LTDAANDFCEKTNNNRIAQYSYLFILFIQFICSTLGKYGFETNVAGYFSALKLEPLANICD